MPLQNVKSFISYFNPKLDEVIQESMVLFDHEVINQILSQVLPISKGGKRIRPYLAYLMNSQAINETYQPIYESLELIHLFALIHDDIMDECDTRRGESTVQAYSRSYYPDQTPEKLSRITESIAILAGDLVFSLAEQRFQKSLQNLPKQTWIQAYEYFDELKRQVIYGQLLDLHLTSQVKVSAKDVEDKTFFKTASYTIIKPMQIGCILSGREDLLHFCEDFGRPLGLAFQIQDDYLNLTQPEEETGKPQFTDILENQKTEFFLELQKQPEVFSEVSKFIGLESLSKDQTKALSNILQQSGVLEKGLKKFQNLYQQSLEVLDQNKANLPEEIYSALKDLTQYLISRTS